MEKSRTLILDPQQVAQKIKRIAYEILENNLDEKEVVLAGVYKQGLELANALSKELSAIAPFNVSLVKIELDKELPTQSEIKLDVSIESLENKVIILIDDVLNTGRTVAYSLKPFLNIRVKKIQTVFLVNRSHPTFPISPTYTGYALSTTISEHVEVVVKKAGISVYLS